MKKMIVLTLLGCLTIAAVSAQKASGKLLRHVVMFKFAEKATPADVKRIEEAFRALPGKISFIKDFEWGVNNSPEKLNQGLTHCFLVTFSSAADRDAYLIHPSHKEFVSIARSNIEKATVLDYWMHK